METYTEPSLTFGEPVEGVDYEKRRSAFAIIVNDGKIAVVHTPSGYSLPGGKIEGGETDKQALIREIDEELGWTVAITDFLYTVDQYHYSEDEDKYYLTTGKFFEAKYFATTAVPIEEDHTYAWLTLNKAEAELAPEHLRWAVQQYRMSNELTI